MVPVKEILEKLIGSPRGSNCSSRDSCFVYTKDDSFFIPFFSVGHRSHIQNSANDAAPGTSSGFLERSLTPEVQQPQPPASLPEGTSERCPGSAQTWLSEDLVQNSQHVFYTPSSAHVKCTCAHQHMHAYIMGIFMSIAFAWYVLSL